MSPTTPGIPGTPSAVPNEALHNFVSQFSNPLRPLAYPRSSSKDFSQLKPNLRLLHPRPRPIRRHPCRRRQYPIEVPLPGSRSNEDKRSGMINEIRCTHLPVDACYYALYGRMLQNASMLCYALLSRTRQNVISV